MHWRAHTYAHTHRGTVTSSRAVYGTAPHPALVVGVCASAPRAQYAPCRPHACIVATTTTTTTTTTTATAAVLHAPAVLVVL